MAWYALEALDDALTRTTELMTPFDLGTWARLALLAALTGGIGAGNALQLTPTPGSGGSTEGISGLSTASTALAPDSVTGLVAATPGMGIAAAAALLVLVVVLFFLVLSSAMKFVFFEVVRHDTVTILDYLSPHWGDGVRYALFRVGYLAVFVGLVGGMVGAGVVGGVPAGAAAAVGIPLLVLWAVFGTLVHDFGLLRMIASGTGVVASVRSLWPVVRREWRQVGVYLLVHLVLGIALGILQMLALVGVSLAALVVAGIPTAVLWAVFRPAALVPGVLGVIGWLAAVFLALAPFATYRYYFALSVYEDLTA